jgi:signal transduction histidine kinase
MPHRPIKQIPGTDSEEQLKIYSAVMNYMEDEVHVWEIVFTDKGEIKTWRLKDANPAALKSWNKNLSDFLDKTTEEIFTNTDPVKTFKPIIEKIYQEQKPYHWQSYFEGTNQILDMTSIPVGNFFISTGRDVTLKKQADNFINQAHRMESLGVVAGGVIHDINNVLAILSGNLRLISKLNKEEELTTFIKGASEASVKIKELTDLVLSFTRKKDDCFIDLKVSESLQSIVHLLETSLPHKIKLERDIDFSVPPIKANKININQIILNLSNNAVTAMRETGGTLTLKLTSKKLEESDLPTRLSQLAGKTFAHLSIEDTGPGINDQILENIFEPFYTTNSSGKGSGLGLAIVDTLVKKHNGFIDIKTKLGKGTIFNLFFPTIEE